MKLAALLKIGSPSRVGLAAVAAVALWASACSLEGCPGGAGTVAAPEVVLDAAPAPPPQRPPMACPPYSTPQGWRWQYPRPQGNTLNALWGSSSRDLFAVGDAGAVMHSDGSSWCHLDAGVFADLRGVFGFGLEAVIAVGEGGAIVRFDGTRWAPEPSGVTASLNAVWGSSPESLFIVGGGGVILRFLGGRWHRMESGTVQHLRGVWGRGPEDVLAVGDGGTVLRFDGQSWSRVEVDTTDTLEAVRVGPGGEIWVAARNDGLLRLRRQPVGRWDLDRARTPPRARLSGLSNSGAGQLVAVGRFGLVLRLGAEGVERLQPGPAPHLSAVWSDAAGVVVAVGEGGVILRLDGTQWTDQSSQPRWGLADGAGLGGQPGQPRGGIHALWGLQKNLVFAAGAGGTILRFNGERWSELASGTDERLRALWGTSARDLWAAGDRGTLLRFDGSSWTALESGTTEDLEGLWGSSAGDVFAVGGAGVILHFDGEAWGPQISGTTNSLHAVWGRGPQEVYAVGHSGTVLQYDGAVWTPRSPLVGRHLFAVTGVNGGRTVILGGRGYGSLYREESVIRLTAESVEPMGLAAHPIDALWGTTSGDLYAAGWSGTYHYDGSSWTSQQTGSGEPLRALFGTEGLLLGAGASGIVQRQDPSTAPAEEATGGRPTPEE